MGTKPGVRSVRSTYEFIKTHRKEYSTQAMCRVLGVAPRGYYEWLQHPHLNLAIEEAPASVDPRILHLQPGDLRHTPRIP